MNGKILVKGLCCPGGDSLHSVKSSQDREPSSHITPHPLLLEFSPLHVPLDRESSGTTITFLALPQEPSTVLGAWQGLRKYAV